MADGKETFGSQMLRAFKWHWNLLFLGAGAAFALLSGLSGILIPALLAGELAYLGFLGTNERFQNILRGRALLKGSAAASLAEAKDLAARLEEMIGFLDKPDRARFDNIKERSRAMTDLQRSMQGDRSPRGQAGFKTQSLDRMLWLFLKLLHHKTGLARFLGSTSEIDLQSELSDTESQLRDARERNASARLVASLEEKMATIRDRLSNHAEAAENLAVLNAELDKTEQKINHLCEVGMTSRDGADLSIQIDSVAESVKLSEKTLADLDLGVVFQSPEEEAPPFVSGVASPWETE